jgi:CRISPR/Cas system-associated protein Cas7 (RAMP superfamily)
MRGAGHVARTGKRTGVHRVLVGNPEGKRPLGRLRHRSEYNIEMDLQKVGWECMNWIELDQDRNRRRALLNAVMNFNSSIKCGNFWTSCKPVIFSRKTLLHE